MADARTQCESYQNGMLAVIANATVHEAIMANVNATPRYVFTATILNMITFRFYSQGKVYHDIMIPSSIIKLPGVEITNSYDYS